MTGGGGEGWCTGAQIDRRRAIGRIGACCCGLFSMAAIGACESTDVEALAPEQTPLKDTDEAGLWRYFEKAERELAVSPRRVRDPALEEYIREVTCRVAGDHCASFRIYIMRVPAMNASVSPNGVVLIWSGLLPRLENEAQLAAIMAHEVTHYVGRHSLENYRKAKNNITAAMFFGFGIAMVGGGPLAALPGLAAMSNMLAFSRDQEREADTRGLERMVKAGYSPLEAIRIWENVIAEDEADPHHVERDLFASTHSGSEERKNVLADAARVMGKTGQRVGADEYLARVRPHLETFLEDELQARQPERLLLVLDRLKEADPAAAPPLYYAGEARRLRGAAADRDQARAEYNTALRIDPEYAKAWRGLGLLERDAGNDGAASVAFQRYLDLNPEAPDAPFLRSYISETS